MQQCEAVVASAVAWAQSFVSSMMDHKIRFAETQTRVDFLRSDAERLIIELTNANSNRHELRTSLTNLIAEIDKELGKLPTDGREKSVARSLSELKEFILLNITHVDSPTV
jgi:hypothetical protein